MNFIVFGDSVFSSTKGTLTFFGIIAGFVLFVIVSFFFLHRVRFARWIFMLSGAGLYLFFSILALIQFMRYDAGWKQDFLETGYIVYAHHWVYTDYRQWFALALNFSAALIFLYIFADRALDVDYIIIKKGYELVNEFSWFKPVEVVEVKTETAHTYLIKVLIFGFGLSTIVTDFSDFLVGLFTNTYKHFYVYYSINIVVAGITALIVVLLFVRVMVQTKRYLF